MAILKQRGLWRRQSVAGASTASDGNVVRVSARCCKWTSHHDWFEGRGGGNGKCVLMVMPNDATSRTYARFYAAETTEGGIGRAVSLEEAARLAALIVRGSALDLSGRGSPALA